MKTLFLVFIIIILSFHFVSCKKDNLITDPPQEEIQDYSKYFDYYPLDIGNYWEYGNVNESFFSVEVIGDTIFQNKEYKILEEIYFSGTQDTIYRYERLDSSTSCIISFDLYYNSEFKLDSLAALDGQIYEGSRFISHEEWTKKKVICMSIDSVEIFNETLPRKSLQHFGGTDLPSYTLVKGLGLTYTYFFRNGGYILRSAIIKGKEYN